MSRFTRLAILAAALLGLARLSATPITPTSYTYTTGPSGYGDETGTQLTDGLYNAVIPGANLATPDAYNWVGWSWNDADITFNFGQVVTINSLSLSSVRWEPAGVYLPAKVHINSSVFNVTGTYTNMDKAVLTFNGSWTGSSLNLTLERGGHWTFLDEVTFDGHVGAPTASVPDTGATAALLLAPLALCAALRRRPSRR